MKMRKNINKFIALFAAFTLAFGCDGAMAAQIGNNPSGTAADNIQINNGTIDKNYGIVTYNYGTVNYNYGTVNFNYGTIVNNYGTAGNMGLGSGTVTNNWNKLKISNPKACTYSISSEGNFHTFTTGDVLEVTSGTATVTKSAIGYEVYADTDLDIKFKPAPQYSYTANRSEGGSVSVLVDGAAVRAGTPIAEGTTLEIVAKANAGYRCGAISIVSTLNSVEDTVEPYDGYLTYRPADPSISTETAIYEPETVPAWKLFIDTDFTDTTGITAYQWQKSGSIAFDMWGNSYGTDWENIPGACSDVLYVNSEDFFDFEIYDYVADYRVLVTIDDAVYCLPSILGAEYEAETTGGTAEVNDVISDYYSEYSLNYTMPDATVNINCEFVPILAYTPVDNELDFGTENPEYEAVSPQAIVFTANPGADKEIVLDPDFWSFIPNKLFEFVAVGENGYEAVTPEAIVLANGETATIYVRPKNDLPGGYSFGYVIAKAYARDIADSEGAPETGKITIGSKYIILNFEVNRLTPVITSVSASDITYGQALEESVITGTAMADGHEVAGSFYVVQAEERPDVSSGSYELEFIPDSPDRYKDVYDIPVTIRVLPAVLTVTTESVTVEHTGLPVTAGGVISGLVNGETLTFTVTGSQTDAGSSTNTYSIVWDGTAKQSNYTIVENLGTLTVTASTTPEQPGGDDNGGSGSGGGSSGSGSSGSGSSGSGSSGSGSSGGGYSGGGSSGGSFSGGGFSGGGFSGGDLFAGGGIIGGAVVVDKPENPKADPEKEAAERKAAQQKAEEERYNAKVTVEDNKIADKNKEALYDITSARWSKATVTYSGMTDKLTDLVIGDVVTAGGITYKITKVSGGALEGSKSLRTLKVGNNVTIIERAAFKNCTKLTTVTLGEGVKKLYRASFYGCKKLTSVEVSPNLTYIGQNAFRQCTKLESLELPETLSHIGPSAFYGCKKLESLTINSTLLTKSNVSAGAFKGMSADTVIYVPEEKVEEYTGLFRKKGLNKAIEIKAIPKEG